MSTILTPLNLKNMTAEALQVWNDVAKYRDDKTLLVAALTATTSYFVDLIAPKPVANMAAHKAAEIFFGITNTVAEENVITVRDSYYVLRKIFRLVNSFGSNIEKVDINFTYSSISCDCSTLWQYEAATLAGIKMQGGQWRYFLGKSADSVQPQTNKLLRNSGSYVDSQSREVYSDVNREIYSDVNVEVTRIDLENYSNLYRQIYTNAVKYPTKRDFFKNGISTLVGLIGLAMTPGLNAIAIATCVTLASYTTSNLLDSGFADYFDTANRRIENILFGIDSTTSIKFRAFRFATVTRVIATNSENMDQVRLYFDFGTIVAAQMPDGTWVESM